MEPQHAVEHTQSTATGRPASLYQKLVRATAILSLMVLAALLLCVLGFFVWGVIGGPQYIECVVVSLDASECHLFSPSR